MNDVILGTRGSALALAQSKWVAHCLTQKTGVGVRLRVIRTKGDKIIDKPLQAIGGKGLFTAELEAALLSEEIDFAVHSLKDLPTDEDGELCIACVPAREDPRDAVVGTPLQSARVIGTGSLRRQAQIKQLVSSVEIRGVRGNVDTRIEKMERGQYDSVVLAMAGLNRLGIRRSDIYPLSVEECVPAAGQGALAVQCVRSRTDIVSLLQSIHCDRTQSEVLTERTFLSEYGGGCHIAVGCFAQQTPDGIKATGMIEADDGRVHRLTIQGTQAVNLGLLLAQRLSAAK